MRQGDYFHSPICFVFKKSSLYELKVSRLHLSFKILWCPQRNWTHSKSKLHKTFGCWSSDMLDFDFLEKPGTVFFTTYGLSFFRKIYFHVLFYNWPNVIASLPLLYEIMSNMCIKIICFPDCDVINFAINHSFLIKSGFFMTKNSGRKPSYLKKENTF